MGYYGGDGQTWKDFPHLHITEEVPVISPWPAPKAEDIRVQRVTEVYAIKPHLAWRVTIPHMTWLYDDLATALWYGGMEIPTPNARYEEDE